MTPTTTYLRCAESATMLRETLRRHFPGVRFSVRSKTYSGGASISVSWTDGPRSVEVDRVAQRFAGADFDGMTDSKSYHSTILVSDTAIREVHHGSDFVFCRRDVSDYEGKAAAAEAYIRAHCHLEGSEANPRFGREYVSDLAGAMARDWTDGPESAFRRIVLREGVNA